MAGLGRNCILCARKSLLFHRSVLNLTRIQTPLATEVVVTQVRGTKRWVRPYLQTLLNRINRENELLGPLPPQPRSSKINWNYDSELFAFGPRLGEKLNLSTLRAAFTDRSYVEQEEERRRDLGLPQEDVKLDMQDNTQLAEQGWEVTTNYIHRFLKAEFPLLPDEGVKAIHDYVTQENMLVWIAKHLGVKDLIRCESFPVPPSVTKQVFLAIIGAVNHDQGMQRAEMFVHDFVVAQLVGKDVNAMWDVPNPMGMLAEILQKEGRGEPEPRIINQSGVNTVTPVFCVGVYSDKELLGEASGDTMPLAVEEAARVALANMFKTHEGRKPLALDTRLKTMAEIAGKTDYLENKS
ncbi:MRPL44 [Branchiostoma lanceolatum]|uniref:Large ribosomal subunit protein mL44 n=2 Tax=Branchiostoma lanceolatum TaxID=7740 RepID=A0A8K0EVU9_BRALA|nr:MRPL44 [Branchiostoma lanceolatum]